MCLLAVAALDNVCLEGASTAPRQQMLNMNQSLGDNGTVTTVNEPVGTRYTIAAASLLLWMGTFQVLLSAHWHFSIDLFLST